MLSSLNWIRKTNYIYSMKSDVIFCWSNNSKSQNYFNLGIDLTERMSFQESFHSLMGVTLFAETSAA